MMSDDFLGICRDRCLWKGPFGPRDKGGEGMLGIMGFKFVGVGVGVRVKVMWRPAY